jgi:hypothetical protein
MKCCRTCVHRETYNKRPICRKIVENMKAIFDFANIIYDDGIDTCEYYKKKVE